MADKSYVVLAASNGSLADAKMNFEALKLIKTEGQIRDLTAAVISRSDEGWLKVFEVIHVGKVAAGIGFSAGCVHPLALR